jgi:hypothetical protein
MQGPRRPVEQSRLGADQTVKGSGLQILRWGLVPQSFQSCPPSYTGSGLSSRVGRDPLINLQLEESGSRCQRSRSSLLKTLRGLYSPLATAPRCITLPMGNHLNTQEAAAWLGIKANTLKEWRSDQKGPVFVKYSSGCVRYWLDDLIQWRNDRRHVPSARAAVEESERRISQRKRN